MRTTEIQTFMQVTKIFKLISITSMTIIPFECISTEGADRYIMHKIKYISSAHTQYNHTNTHAAMYRLDVMPHYHYCCKMRGHGRWTLAPPLPLS